MVDEIARNFTSGILAALAECFHTANVEVGLFGRRIVGLHERDLGKCTAQCVRKMIGFNPTKGWTAVKGN